MNRRRYHVVFNPMSGSALSMNLTTSRLREMLEAAALDAFVDSEGSFPDRLGRALDSDAEVIVAAGGDGTVTALASALVGSNKTLGLLPLGTANLLARDLGLPLDVTLAIQELHAMQPTRIDVGEVNGRVFLHNVTVGFVTGLARAREHIRGQEGVGTLLGFCRHFVRRLSRARRFAVEVTLDASVSRIVRAHAITVANNAYDQGLGQLFSRSSLTDGHLTVYTLRHITVGEFLRLATSMILGRWQQEEAIDIEDAGRVTIRIKKPTTPVMFDGEIETLSVPLEFQIRPKALSVLAPVKLVEQASEDDQPEFVVGI